MNPLNRRVLAMGALQSPSIEGALQSPYRGFVKPFYGRVFTMGFAKPLYRRGFAMGGVTKSLFY